MIRVAVVESAIRANLERVLDGLSIQIIHWDGSEEQLISHSANIAILNESDLKSGRKFQKWHGCIWVLQSRDVNHISECYAEGFAEDIILHPFIRNELITKIRWADHFQQLRDLESSSESVAELVKKLEEDLSLAEKIQRSLIREKFPEITTLSVKSKYYCGLKSGGDYFDFVQFPDGNVAVLLTDASSYGLSSKLLQALTRIGLAANPIHDPALFVKELFHSLRDDLNEKNRLGLFFGILNKKTYEFHYHVYGDFWLLQSSNAFSWHLKGDAQEAMQANTRIDEDGRRLQLRPGDRLLLCSDGIREAIGAEMETVTESCITSNTSDPLHVLNELSFQIKKNSDEMPAQDCSFLLMQVPDKALRLAL